MNYKYLNDIHSPQDLKALPKEVLPEVCTELRAFIVEELSHNPGHLASSLGTIELTVALHYVYDTPDDKLVWDVGHQAYAHKILTGRRERFSTNRHFKGLAPFPTPAESEYDAFIAGHASNSISAALGIEMAEELLKPEGERRHVVAIIGDGAMTGGLAFEGLNNTSMDRNNLLIVLNDNNMAIDPLKGGFTQYLVDLTTSEGYNEWRWRTYQKLSKWGVIDERRKYKIRRFTNEIKMSKQRSNIFRGLNMRYFGPTDGHDVLSLVRILSEIKDFKGPKVLHIITVKGKGYEPAEKDQTVWHAPGEFNVESGVRLQRPTGYSEVRGQEALLWQEVFGETLLELAQNNPKIVGITPAMPSGCSMSIMQKELPKRVFDVGIAEGHAVTFSAGLAKDGAIPFCNIYSSFLQRAYDNIVHDVAITSQHVILCIDRAGIVGNDGATHHGLLDMAFLRPIPNMQIVAPRTGEELRQAMQMAVDMEGPVAIRYPRGRVPFIESDESSKAPEEQGLVYGRGELLKQGTEKAKMAVLSIGAIGNVVQDAIQDLDVTHYAMRWLKPIDTDILDEVGQHYKEVMTVEDGMVHGGLGSAVAEYMSSKGYPCHITRVGVEDQFVEHGSTAELMHMLRLDKEGLLQRINETINHTIWK